jgi:hypothetical protein
MLSSPVQSQKGSDPFSIKKRCILLPKGISSGAKNLFFYYLCQDSQEWISPMRIIMS